MFSGLNLWNSIPERGEAAGRLGGCDRAVRQLERAVRVEPVPARAVPCARRRIPPLLPSSDSRCRLHPAVQYQREAVQVVARLEEVEQEGR